MKAARIVFQECDEGETFQRTLGTKVITEDGEIHGVVRATIHVEVNDVVRAEVEIMPVIDKIDRAETHFVIRHPLTGKMEELSKMIFADGSVVDFGEVEHTAEHQSEHEITNLSSWAREFVLGKKLPTPPPPADTDGSDLFDAPSAGFLRRTIRNVFHKASWSDGS